MAPPTNHKYGKCIIIKIYIYIQKQCGKERRRRGSGVSENLFILTGS